MTPRCPVDSLQVHYCQPQDSLMATMVQRTEIPGRPGVPLPYQLRTDDGITSVILLCMCMLAYVLSRGRHFLWQQVKDFFSTRERSSLFAEETNTDVRYRVLLLLHTGMVFGLLVFEYLSGRLPTALHAHPIRWLGLYIVACLAYYLLKCALYSFANWTFFDKQKSRRWLDSYFLVFVGDRNEESERRYIRELLAYNIEGMIVLSHTIPSEELASYHIPIVTIEREDRYTCSVNTDNYMGGVQAASLLYKNNCDVLIHINVNVPPEVPSYGRIQGFLDICAEHGLSHELLLEDLGNTYQENKAAIQRLAAYLDHKYAGMKKGIFLANDTYANILLNFLIQRHGSLRDDYRIIGFDNSPISGEAVIPTSTVGQQIDKIASAAMEILVDQMKERKKITIQK